MDEQEHVSPDGQLRLLVIVPDGDLTIGFDGCSAHTHGSILAERYQCDEEAAAKHFVTAVFESRLVIAVQWTAGVMTNAYVLEANWQTVEDVVSDFRRNGEPGEAVELRLWDGTRVETLSFR